LRPLSQQSRPSTGGSGPVPGSHEERAARNNRLASSAQRQQALDQDSDAQIAAKNCLKVYVDTVKATVLEDPDIRRELSLPDADCLRYIIVSDAEAYLRESRNASARDLMRRRESVKIMADVILKRLLWNLDPETQRALRAKWEDCDILVTDSGRGHSLDA
jgi:hypothetical protein